jgi:DNA polymerase-3 subunit delta'
MTLDAVKGQARAVDRLLSAVRRGTVHHAYLFVGPSGVGKELAARGFTQALLCTERPGQGCGTCSTCQRVERGSHPDVQWLMPEAEQVARGLAARADFTNVPSRELKVEQVRRLQERLSLHALEAKRKVAVLLCGEGINDPAQNALLKTLEEPPSDTTLILVAVSADRLLPTIRSRVSLVPFAPLPRDFVASELERARKLDRATAELVAELSGGSLGTALALDVEGLKGRRELLEAFEKLSPSDARPWLAFAEQHGSSRDEAEEALTLLSVWLRDLLHVKAGLEDIAQRDLLSLARTASARSEAELLRRARLVERAKAALARNGSARMALERMLIEMAEGAP